MGLQHGNFSYDHPLRCILEAIRAQTLPTELLEFLDMSKVQYFQGTQPCLSA